MTKKILSLVLTFICCASFARAQQAGVTISLNEQFFDTLLDAMLNNSTLEFPIAANNPKSKTESSKSAEFSFNKIAERRSSIENANRCEEKIVLRREIDGVRTAVRFRDGKIYAPIAFTGTYNPPLIGCLDFSGYAETNIELEFDRNRQTLFGRARVLNVKLGGAPNVAGNLMARLVQNSIDNKINPIEILRTDKISFVVPIQRNGSLNMKAVGVNHEIGQQVLNIRINYEFQKSN
jgi:hypothetical protein